MTDWFSGYMYVDNFPAYSDLFSVHVSQKGTSCFPLLIPFWIVCQILYYIPDTVIDTGSV